jgi:hypothetical protein
MAADRVNATVNTPKNITGDGVFVTVIVNAVFNET